VLNILHIIPNLKKGGAERLVIDIVRALFDLSNNVKLILFEDQVEYPIDDIAPFVEVVPAKVSLSVWKRNTYEIDRLQKAIDSFQPHIIHTHLFETEIVSRSCHYPQAKWFTHVHSAMPSFKRVSLKIFWNKKLATNFYEKLFLLKRYRINNGNTFLAISTFIEVFLRNSIPQKRFVIKKLPNAINTSHYAKAVFSANQAIKKDALQLISIGRLNENKNQKFLLEVVEEIHRQGISVQLIILGEGPSRKDLETFIDAKHFQTMVSLPGNVEDIRHHLWKADIYVHSAINEAFGLAILEALAAGLPVVSLNGGGNTELIKHGINGYLINSLDVKLFAESVLKLYRNSECYSDFSFEAKRFASQFDFKSYSSRLLNIYKA